MAFLSDAFREVSSKAEEALHTLEAAAHKEWERVSVRDCCGRAEAAALTLENLIRGWPGQRSGEARVSGNESGDTVEEEEAILQLEAQNCPESAGESLSSILRERFGGRNRAPLFARLESLPHLLGGSHPSGADGRGGVKAAKGGVKTPKVDVSISKGDARVVRFGITQKGKLDESPGERQPENALHRRSPLAALSWVPAFLGGGAGGVKNEDGEKESSWVEEVGNERRRYFPRVNDDGSAELAMEALVDKRPLGQKLTDGFRDKFFPVGYPER